MEMNKNRKQLNIINLTLIVVLTGLCLISMSNAIYAQGKRDPADERAVTNDKIRILLFNLKKVDQQIRDEFVQDRNNRDVITRMTEIDNNSTKQLKEIIQKHGWPTVKMVGKDGNRAAFLIVQHSSDHEFQKDCLKYIKNDAEKGDSSWEGYALLTDRLLVNEGKKQIYGTQFDIVNDELKPLPIDDEENVDQRRKAIGLLPLAEYREQLKKAYNIGK